MFFWSKCIKPGNIVPVHVGNMLAVLWVYFGINFFLVLMLGYLQTRVKLLDGVDDTRTTELYAWFANVCLIVQAFVSAGVLAGTGWFPVAGVILAFTLLCHHAVIHRNSRFDDEQCSCAPFQLKDICNHETWVVASLVASLISVFGV